MTVLCCVYLTCMPAVLWALSAEVEPPPSPRQITLKHLDPAEVIYLTDKGPYWQMGKIFAELGKLMADHDQAGAMWACFLNDPLLVPPDKLEIEVGFFARGDFEVDPPAERKTLPARTVASLVVEGPYGTAPTHHLDVLNWIQSHGYVRDGHIMEIYPPRRGTVSTVEIQVPILTRDDAEHTAADPGVPGPTPAPEPVGLVGLISQGEFVRAAELLVPDAATFPPPHRQWFLDLVERLRIVNQLAGIKLGPAAEDVNALVEPILGRARLLSAAPSASQEPRPAGPPYATESEGQAHLKRELLHRVDRVITGTHLGKLTAGDIVSQLGAILDQALSITGRPSEQTPPQEATHGAENTVTQDPAGGTAPGS